MVGPSVIEDVRLDAFKSFDGASLPLEDLTLVVGRNGSGKSNALDGLWVLSRLAQGNDIREALDGGREGPAVRGGVAGCAPFGASQFSLGCTVRTGKRRVRLDVTVQTEPHVQIVWERLSADGRDLLLTDAPDAHSSDICARWDNRTQGPNPKLTFRASRLLTSQVGTRVPSTSAGQKVHSAAAQVLAALGSVFVLDPVPHLMRQYVPGRDELLRRDADNLSAAVASLLREPANRALIMQALSTLNEQDILDVTTSASELGDLMLTVVERSPRGEFPVPARVMSDGSLRFLAILTSLMQAPTVDAVPDATDDAYGQTTVVIEELENGLHASQAATLIGLVRDQVTRRRVRALATAHSPAVLEVLTGKEHRNVVVCERNTFGHSTLTRLTDLVEYPAIVAMGGLGRAAAADRLRAVEPDGDAFAMIDSILGRSTT